MTTTNATRTDRREVRIKAGPRGGRYYINKNGGKTYVDRSTPVDKEQGSIVPGIFSLAVVVGLGLLVGLFNAAG
jgi:hypothetical protein